MALALPELVAICLLVVAYGLIMLGAALTQLLNWFLVATLGQIPLLGNLIAAPADRVLQAVSNYMGQAAAGVEGYIGQCFHIMARLTEWVGSEIAGVGLLAAATAERLAQDSVRIVEHDVIHTATTQTVRIVDHTVHDVHEIERVADSSTTAAVGALAGRVGALEGEWHDAIEPTLEALRERAHELEAGYTRAWELLRAHERALGIGAVTAAVAVALEQMGASWIRCEGAGAAGRALCGLGPKLIEDLIEGVIGVAALLELCPLTGLLVDAAEAPPLQSLLKELIDGTDALIKCRGVALSVGLPEGAYAAVAAPTAYAELAPVV